MNAFSDQQLKLPHICHCGYLARVILLIIPIRRPVDTGSNHLSNPSEWQSVERVHVSQKKYICASLIKKVREIQNSNRTCEWTMNHPVKPRRHMANNDTRLRVLRGFTHLKREKKKGTTHRGELQVNQIRSCSVLGSGTLHGINLHRLKSATSTHAKWLIAQTSLGDTLKYNHFNPVHLRFTVKLHTSRNGRLQPTENLTGWKF